MGQGQGWCPPNLIGMVFWCLRLCLPGEGRGGDGRLTLDGCTVEPYGATSMSIVIIIGFQPEKQTTGCGQAQLRCSEMEGLDGTPNGIGPASSNQSWQRALWDEMR